MAGNAAIWRATSEDGNKQGPEPQGAGTDKIEFDLTNVVPDTTGHIHNTEIDVETGIAENEKPFADINEIQDTKMARITLTITGSIQNPMTSGAAIKMKVWMLEDKTSVNLFPKGRFGLRLNDFPIFNLTPNAGDNAAPRGYVLQSIKFIRDGDTKGKVSFIAILRFSGDKGAAGNNYAW